VDLQRCPEVSMTATTQNKVPVPDPTFHFYFLFMDCLHLSEYFLLGHVCLQCYLLLCNSKYLLGSRLALHSSSSDAFTKTACTELNAAINR